MFTQALPGDELTSHEYISSALVGGDDDDSEQPVKPLKQQQEDKEGGAKEEFAFDDGRFHVGEDSHDDGDAINDDRFLMNDKRVSDEELVRTSAPP